MTDKVNSYPDYAHKLWSQLNTMIHKHLFNRNADLIKQNYTLINHAGWFILFNLEEILSTQEQNKFKMYYRCACVFGFAQSLMLMVYARWAWNALRFPGHNKYYLSKVVLTYGLVAVADQ